MNKYIVKFNVIVGEYEHTEYTVIEADSAHEAKVKGFSSIIYHDEGKGGRWDEDNPNDFYLDCHDERLLKIHSVKLLTDSDHDVLMRVM